MKSAVKFLGDFLSHTKIKYKKHKKVLTILEIFQN